jgi:hypothetical protein
MLTGHYGGGQKASTVPDHVTPIMYTVVGSLCIYVVDISTVHGYYMPLL